MFFAMNLAVQLECRAREPPPSPSNKRPNRLGSPKLINWWSSFESHHAPLLRKRYGALDVADVRRLRELEAENARLKKMLAERDLEIDVMKEVAKKVVSVAARRRQVAFVTARGLSQRRTCRLLSVARSSLGYVSRLEQRDAPVLAYSDERDRRFR